MPVCQWMLEVWQTQSSWTHLLPRHVRTDAGGNEHKLLPCTDILGCSHTPVTHQRNQQLQIGMNNSIVPLQELSEDVCRAHGLAKSKAVRKKAFLVKQHSAWPLTSAQQSGGTSNGCRYMASQGHHHLTLCFITCSCHPSGTLKPSMTKRSGIPKMSSQLWHIETL